VFVNNKRLNHSFSSTAAAAQSSSDGNTQSNVIESNISEQVQITQGK
jgi:hypothetical protein